MHWLEEEEEAAAHRLLDEFEDPCLVIGNAEASSTQTQLLFVKGSVAVIPSAHTCIMGKLSIAKFDKANEDGNSLSDCSRTFVAWFPDSTTASQTTMQNGNPGQHDVLENQAYAIHPIPVAEIKAIRAWTPPFRTHTVTIILHRGETVPTLHFKQGGVKAFLKALCTVVGLESSQDDPWTLLVHHVGEPSALGAMSIHADDDVLWRNSQIDLIQSRMQSKCLQKADEEDRTAPITAAHVKDHLTDIMDALQKFSLEAKKSVSSFLSGSFSQDMPSVLDSISSLSKDTDDDATTCSISPSSSWEVVEKKHLNHAALPTQRHAPFSEDELPCCLDSHGALTSSGETTMRYRVFNGCADPSVRHQVWKYFLGVDKLDSTLQERQDAIQQRLERYKMLKLQWKLMSPEQTSRFRKWRDRCRQVDKDVARTDRSHPLFASEQGMRVLKNILLSHIMWNWDLGYCQGMSDMATPFIHVALGHDGCLSDEVESEAFWAFAALMEKIGGNFSIDGTSMHTQLQTLQILLKHLDPPLYEHLDNHQAANMFFCFRWILVLFKREFPFEQVLKLWDCLYARPQDNLHIFMCLAILIRHRDTILERRLNFDGMMEYCISLRGTIPLETTIMDAEKLLKASMHAHIV